MAKYRVTVDIDVINLHRQTVADMVKMKLAALIPTNVGIKRIPESLTLEDYPRQAIRPAVGGELYRITIPGLQDGNNEVTVPVHEDSRYSRDLLAEILEENGFDASEAPL